MQSGSETYGLSQHKRVMDSECSLVLKPTVCHITRELWILNAVIEEAKEDGKPKCWKF